MTQSELVYCDELSEGLTAALEGVDYDSLFLLTDSNVARCGWFGELALNAKTYIMEAGEAHKNLDTAARVWTWLTHNGATRRSLMLNIGGGVVTDLGGFTASTFKRGIRFVNVPTTLLAMSDAAIGGKTGIDFDGLKNEVGTFAPALKVIIADNVLSTLPESELRSGFAEVVKMAIISSEPIYRQLLTPDALHNPDVLKSAARHAAAEKQRIVAIDPYEGGLRRRLNFGHTAGHAYESYAASIGKPISHGEAVAHGMLRALELSRDRNGYPAERVEEYRHAILERYYNPLPFGEEAEPALEALMRHDKKNLQAGTINWILLPLE